MEDRIVRLEQKAKEARRDIVRMIYQAGSGHPGGSLSCIDILVTLYQGVMDLTLDENGKRVDQFVLSKGHAAPALYAVLSQKGFIPKEDLATLRKYDSYLEGHPSNKIPGVDVSSGSLGQGLSVANGFALAKKLDEKAGYVYCVVGDGELEEGQIWEAVMSANKYTLTNLILFVDYNGLQIDGSVKEVKNVDNLDEKFNSFGWNTQVIEGNDITQISEAIEIAKHKLNDRPNCIIAKTTKGKGIPFMENKVEWHGRALKEEEFEEAMALLK